MMYLLSRTAHFKRLQSSFSPTASLLQCWTQLNFFWNTAFRFSLTHVPVLLLNMCFVFQIVQTKPCLSPWQWKKWKKKKTHIRQIQTNLLNYHLHVCDITCQHSFSQWPQAVCHLSTGPICGGYMQHRVRRRPSLWSGPTAGRPPVRQLYCSSTAPQAAHGWLHAAWCCHCHNPPETRTENIWNIPFWGYSGINLHGFVSWVFACHSFETPNFSFLYKN